MDQNDILTHDLHFPNLWPFGTSSQQNKVFDTFYFIFMWQQAGLSFLFLLLGAANRKPRAALILGWQWILVYYHIILCHLLQGEYCERSFTLSFILQNLYCISLNIKDWLTVSILFHCAMVVRFNSFTKHSNLQFLWINWIYWTLRSWLFCWQDTTTVSWQLDNY